MDKTTWLLLSDEEKKTQFSSMLTTLIELDKNKDPSLVWTQKKPLEKLAFQILDWAQD